MGWGGGGQVDYLTAQTRFPHLQYFRLENKTFEDSKYLNLWSFPQPFPPKGTHTPYPLGWRDLRAEEGTSLQEGKNTDPGLRKQGKDDFSGRQGF